MNSLFYWFVYFTLDDAYKAVFKLLDYNTMKIVTLTLNMEVDKMHEWA